MDLAEIRWSRRKLPDTVSVAWLRKLGQLVLQAAALRSDFASYQTKMVLWLACQVPMFCGVTFPAQRFRSDFVQLWPTYTNVSYLRWRRIIKSKSLVCSGGKTLLEPRCENCTLSEEKVWLWNIRRELCLEVKATIQASVRTLMTFESTTVKVSPDLVNVEESGNFFRKSQGKFRIESETKVWEFPRKLWK